MKRVATLTVLGTLKNASPQFPKDNKEPSTRSVGTLSLLFQLKPFLWIIKRIDIFPTNLQDQILAIAIYDHCQLPYCPTIKKALHICDFKTQDNKNILTQSIIVPSNLLLLQKLSTLSTKSIIFSSWPPLTLMSTVVQETSGVDSWSKSG
jgi:hypothetical protein